jgi:hypothetical protein
MIREVTNRYDEAVVRCYHCTQIVGALRRKVGTLLPGMTFLPAAGGSTITIQRLSTLRCPACTGPLFAEDFEVVERINLAALPLERPRRGRPPKHRPAMEQDELVEAPHRHRKSPAA